MCSATVPSGLPSCICLCYDGVCTTVEYCTGAGCYIKQILYISVYASGSAELVSVLLVHSLLPQ
jgi:hypothetical protein